MHIVNFSLFLPDINKCAANIHIIISLAVRSVSLLKYLRGSGDSRTGYCKPVTVKK